MAGAWLLLPIMSEKGVVMADVPRMPRIIGLLGFTETEWAAWQELKSQMGDTRELITEMKTLNNEIRRGLLQIAIINEMFYRMYPDRYRDAAEALGFKVE
jgi:hypothetical protein